MAELSFRTSDPERKRNLAKISIKAACDCDDDDYRVRHLPGYLYLVGDLAHPNVYIVCSAVIVQFLVACK